MQCFVISPVCGCVCKGRAGRRVVSEPYYSQHARSVCISLSTFFITLCFIDFDNLARDHFKNCLCGPPNKKVVHALSKSTYFISLRDAASLATAPASRAAAEMYDSANGQMTVTSQLSALPLCHGMRESPSRRIPLEIIIICVYVCSSTCNSKNDIPTVVAQCSLSGMTHAPFHASVVRPASQAGPIHVIPG